MNRKRKAGLVAGGVLVAIVLTVVFVIGLPGGDASISATKNPQMEPGKQVTLCANVTNERPVITEYMVEVGTIPDDVARGWFPSAFSMFGSEQESECCVGQDNIEDEFVELGPYETKEVCQEIYAPYEGIEDKCGGTDYWVGEGSDYSNFFMVSNHCNFREGEKQDGFEMYDVEVKSTQVGEGGLFDNTDDDETGYIDKIIDWFGGLI